MADAMDSKVNYMSLDVPKIFAFTLVEVEIGYLLSPFFTSNINFPPNSTSKLSKIHSIQSHSKVPSKSFWSNT